MLLTRKASRLLQQKIYDVTLQHTIYTLKLKSRINVIKIKEPKYVFNSKRGMC